MLNVGAVRSTLRQIVQFSSVVSARFYVSYVFVGSNPALVSCCIVSSLNKLQITTTTNGTQRNDSVYFDLWKSSDIIPHNIFLCMLSNSRLPTGHVHLFHSYLANRKFYFWNPFVFTSCEIWRDSRFHLRPLALHIFINDIFDFIHNF
jgi:hypothetical protein